ncbi:MAG TPA: hypothetical protein VM513_12295 [Kofleriaceae bacterium]|jgi:hypothetical protein|nr:hypothetical protein [Kofleriaceae bacterium]
MGRKHRHQQKAKKPEEREAPKGATPAGAPEAARGEFDLEPQAPEDHGWEVHPDDVEP